jgi:hypothetical protein
MLKRDNGRFSGDDDANALALTKGMNEGDFINGYMQRTGANAQTARQALAGIENSYGAKMGTDAMRVAAFRARTSSKTAYASGRAGQNQAYTEAASLVNQGLMTQADATASLKSNKERADFAGVGFNETFKMVGRATERYKDGARGDLSKPNDYIVSQKETDDLADDALRGASPGLLAGGYHLGTSSLAPAMARRLKNGIKDAAKNGGDWSEIMPQFAAYNARKNMLGSANEINGDIIGKQAGAEMITVPVAANPKTGRPAGTTTMTIDAVADALRNPEKAMEAFGIDSTGYTRIMREYNNSMVGEANNELQRRQQQGTNPLGGGMPPSPMG